METVLLMQVLVQDMRVCCVEARYTPIGTETQQDVVLGPSLAQSPSPSPNKPSNNMKPMKTAEIPVWPMLLNIV
jgi:hypothetical protein